MIKNKFSCKREELTINGLVYRAEGDKLPVIILSHGFMANYKTTEAYAKQFAKMGYAALIYDFNGGGMFSKSEGKSTDMSVLTEKKDLLAVIDAVSELSYVDKDNLTLLGCSQGGFVSAMVANGIPDKVKNLILFYPALCIPDDARTGQMMFAKFDPQNVPKIVKCGPMKLGRQYVTDVLEMNSFEQIRNYYGPVLIIHGTAMRDLCRDAEDWPFYSYFCQIMIFRIKQIVYLSYLLFK